MLKSDPGLGMSLKKGKFAGLDGDMLIIEFPADGSEIFVQKLNKPDKREAVEKCMSEAFGQPLHVQIGSRAESKKPSAPSADGKKKLDQVYEAFPRDKIEIIDE